MDLMICGVVIGAGPFWPHSAMRRPARRPWNAALSSRPAPSACSHLPAQVLGTSRAERHARRRTAHAGLPFEVLGLLPGSKPGSPSGSPRDCPSRSVTARPALPADPPVPPEIAGELCVSVNTTRTHMRHVYNKLGAHRRREAVERARTLGLLAPSTRGT